MRKGVIREQLMLALAGAHSEDGVRTRDCPVGEKFG
jgi:hypothetical protein